jgi:hypothetical protein
MWGGKEAVSGSSSTDCRVWISFAIIIFCDNYFADFSSGLLVPVRKPGLKRSCGPGAKAVLC